MVVWQYGSLVGWYGRWNQSSKCHPVKKIVHNICKTSHLRFRGVVGFFKTHGTQCYDFGVEINDFGFDFKDWRLSVGMGSQQLGMGPQDLGTRV